MPKIKIKVSIRNELEDTSYEVPAIIQEENIKYKEPDETTVTYQYNNNTLLRENKELRMKYPFDLNRRTTGEIEVKELDQSMKIKIDTNKLERKKHNIEIDFSIEEKNFLYKIEEIV